MQVEEKGQGSVPWSVYGVYIQAAGGPLAFLFIISLFMLNVGSTAFSNWWLSYWIKEGSGVRLLINGKIVSKNMAISPYSLAILKETSLVFRLKDVMNNSHPG